MRLALLILLSITLSLRAEEKAAGRWEGSAQIPGQDLKLIVDLASADSGKWNGSLSIPALQLKGASLDAIAINGDEVSFAVTSALADPHLGQAKFRGRLAADGKFSGDFTQAGNTAPFTLSKTGPPQIEAAPRSTNIK